MGMSTHVVGFKPPDEKFKAMKKIWDACRAAKVDPPREVLDFFGDDAPDDNGVEVALQNYSRGAMGYLPGVTPWQKDDSGGFEVDIRKLDPDIKIIRFYNSW